MNKKFWPFAAIAAALVMLGMSFAAVPIYNLFCKSTGYAGTTKAAAAKPVRVVNIPMEVRFDTNTEPGLPLEFTADHLTRTVKLGETALVFFKVHNPTDEPVSASATFNVAPFKAGQYFTKLECFCFKPRTFGPGETLELPVVFYVDPRIAEDRDTRELTQITLSYTYFRQRGAGGVTTAALEPAAGPGRDVATR